MSRYPDEYDSTSARPNRGVDGVAIVDEEPRSLAAELGEFELGYWTRRLSGGPK